MRTQEINIYKYDELSNDVKERVLDKYRANNTYEFLEEYLTELVKERIEEKGIQIIKDFKVYYALSSCQGDGLQFNGTFEYKGLTIYIKQSGRYYHKFAVTMDTYKDGESIEDDKEFIQLFNAICAEAEKEGYAYIESEDHEDSIKDNLEANEREFYEDGRTY